MRLLDSFVVCPSLFLTMTDKSDTTNDGHSFRRKMHPSHSNCTFSKLIPDKLQTDQPSFGEHPSIIYCISRVPPPPRMNMAYVDNCSDAHFLKYFEILIFHMMASAVNNAVF